MNQGEQNLIHLKQLYENSLEEISALKQELQIQNQNSDHKDNMNKSMNYELNTLFNKNDELS